MLKTLTGLLALSTLGVAQGSSFTSQAQSPSGYRCGFKDGNYCFRDNLESPFIVRCVGGRGVLGNCNDKFGAKGSTRNENPCYQPDSRKYDAACSTNRGMVYPENGRRPFLRPDYRPHRPPGLDDFSKDLGIGDCLNRDTTSEKQFGSLGQLQGQGGYGNQGVYGGRPEGGYGDQGQPPFGNGNNNNQINQNQNQNQNNNANNNINNNANNNANSNQNQNTNANQNAKPNNNNGGSLVGGPPIQKDAVKDELGKRQEEDGDESSPENDASSCPDDMEQGNEGDLIPPNDSGGDSTPGKRMVVNTAKKGSSARVETKTSGIIIAMAMVIALV